MVNFTIALHRIYIQQNFQKILFKLDDLSCYIISISRALDLYIVFFNNHMTGLGGNRKHSPCVVLKFSLPEQPPFVLKEEIACVGLTSYDQLDFRN